MKNLCIIKYLAILIALVGTPASAEEPKEILARANAHFDLGKFAQAAADYEKLYEVHPDPVLFYNIAQSYRLAGDSDKALFFYKRFRTKLPDHPNAPEVTRRIAELEKLQEQQRLSKLPPNEPTPLRTTVGPPEPKAEPRAEPKPDKQPEAKAEPAPRADEPAPQDEANPPFFKKIWFWGVVAAAVVVIAGVSIGVAVASSGAPAFTPNFGEAGPGKTGALVTF
jgi:tetratricopeptide (TPR) repeat protein